MFLFGIFGRSIKSFGMTFYVDKKQKRRGDTNFIVTSAPLRSYELRGMNTPSHEATADFSKMSGVGTLEVKPLDMSSTVPTPFSPTRNAA